VQSVAAHARWPLGALEKRTLSSCRHAEDGWEWPAIDTYLNYRHHSYVPFGIKSATKPHSYGAPQRCWPPICGHCKVSMAWMDGSHRHRGPLASCSVHQFIKNLVSHDCRRRTKKGNCHMQRILSGDSEISTIVEFFRTQH